MEYEVQLSTPVQRTLIGVRGKPVYGELIVLLQSLEQGPRPDDDAVVRDIKIKNVVGDLHYGIEELKGDFWQLSYFVVKQEKKIYVPLLKGVLA